jgi:hypothetical protein
VSWVVGWPGQRLCQPARLAMRAKMNRDCGIAALAAVLAVGGCGSEPTFTAQEFVDGVDRQGVELRLGVPLVTDEQGKELYAVELEPLGGPRVDSGGEPVHAGGSLSVYDDDGAADGEFATCRDAVDLLCFRAANVVVVLEGGGIEAQQLGLAIQKLAGE